MWINFSQKKIYSNNLLARKHPLYSWQESIFSIIKNWKDNNQKTLECFTSGSTGFPRKIFLKKNELYENAKKTVDTLKLGSKKIKGLLCLSPDYIASKMFLIRSIIFSWNIYCIPPTSNPLKNIKENFDIVSMVPLQVFYSSLYQLEKLKIILIGGGPISIEIEKKLQKISTRCYLTYGMTETLGHIALKRINGKKKKSYFQSLQDISLNVDKRNCLGIFMKKKIFIQTNDIVNLFSEHKFNWIGRYDNVINSGGIKIIPELIEKELYPFIYKRFIITSIPDNILGEKIVLVIEGNSFFVKIPKHIFKGKKRFYKPKYTFFIKNFMEKPYEKLKRKEIRNFLIKNYFPNKNFILFSNLHFKM